MRIPTHGILATKVISLRQDLPSTISRRVHHTARHLIWSTTGKYPRTHPLFTIHSRLAGNCKHDDSYLRRRYCNSSISRKFKYCFTTSSTPPSSVVMGHLGPAQGQCPGAQSGGCEFCAPPKKGPGSVAHF